MCQSLFKTVFILVLAIAVLLGVLDQLELIRIFPNNDGTSIVQLLHSNDKLPGDSDTWENQKKDYDDKFESHQKGEGDGDVTMVDYYYNMATDFYEYGWGTSFHFAHTLEHESHDDSIKRHEHRLADELKLKAGDVVLDAGCGVGGPAREIARYSGAKIIAVTLNDYQVVKAKEHSIAENITIDQVDFLQMDYTQLRFPENTFDKIYSIESTCHAPTIKSVLSELHRVLKPGGEYAGYHWLSAAGYESGNKNHDEILRKIEYGDGLPPLRNLDQVKQAIKDVGFELISEEDLAQDTKGTRAWYSKLDMGYWTHQTTHFTCWVTEFFGLAPKGTLSLHSMLLEAASGLVDGGKANCFTPMHLIHVRKPLN